MQQRQEMGVRSLGQKDPLEREMATHCSILAWRIPRTEEPGGLQSMGLQRVGHDWVIGCASARARARVPTHTHTHTHTQGSWDMNQQEDLMRGGERKKEKRLCSFPKEVLICCNYFYSCYISAVLWLFIDVKRVFLMGRFQLKSGSSSSGLWRQRRSCC